MANPKAQIDIVANTKGFKREVASVGGILKKVENQMQAVSFAAKLMFVAQVAAIGATIASASELEETMSKFETVFKDQADAAREWLAVTAKAVNRAEVEIAGFLATLQDTFVPFGFARDKARELSQQVTALGIDLASFNNSADDEAIQLLTSALVGNHEAVRRFGILITESTLKAKLLEQGIKGGTQAATEQEKVMARLAIIFGATKDAQGDAERTSGSFANQLKGLQAEVISLAAAFGNILLPAATALVSALREGVGPLVVWITANKELAIVITGLSVGVTTLLASLSTLVKVYGFMAVGAGLASTALTVLGTKLGIAGAQAQISGLHMAAFSTANTAATSTLGITAGAIAALVAVLAISVLAIRSARQEMERFEKSSRQAADALRKFFKTRAQGPDPDTTAEIKALAVEEQFFIDQARRLLEHRDALRESLGTGFISTLFGTNDAIKENIRVVTKQISRYEVLAVSARDAEDAQRSLEDSLLVGPEEPGPDLPEGRALGLLEKRILKTAEAERKAHQSRIDRHNKNIQNLEDEIEAQDRLETVERIRLERIVALGGEEGRLALDQLMRLDELLRREKEREKIAKAGEVAKSLEDEADALRKSLLTKEQIREEEEKRVRVLLAAGKITQKTADAALAAIAERNKEAEKTAKTFSIGTESLTGALSRIAGAAATRETEDLAVAKKTAAATEKTAEATKETAAATKTVPGLLSDILLAVTDLNLGLV